MAPGAEPPQVAEPLRKPSFAAWHTARLIGRVWAASRRSVDEGPDRGDYFSTLRVVKSRSRSRERKASGTSRLERVRRQAGGEVADESALWEGIGQGACGTWS